MTPTPINFCRWLMLFCLGLNGCGEKNRWCVEIPQDYKIVGKAVERRGRESAIGYELRDPSGRKFDRILIQVNFLTDDEAELQSALKEAAIDLGRKVEELSSTYATCLKAEGRACDAWLLLDRERTKAILLMVRK